MPKCSCFRTLIGRQRGNGYQTLRKSAWQHLHPIVPSLSYKLSRKSSLLVGSETLRLCLKPLIGDDKYSLLQRENFQQPIQIQLSKKSNNFC